MTRNWELAFVLPNLTLPPSSSGEPGDGSGGNWSRGISLGQDVIAIVSGYDSRAEELARRSAAANKLLNGFRDMANRSYRPAALLIREDAPQKLHRDLGAAVAFRNAAAFAFLLGARARAVYQGSYVDASWADTFLFYPTVIGKEDRLITDTPALRAIFSEAAPFHATQSPYIALCGERLYPDWYLLRALGRAWGYHFLTGKRHFRRWVSLFRSLETAFTACSLGAQNQASVADYGTQLALWVSALEILAWPQHKRANLANVLSLLGRYTWAEPKLRASRFVTGWRGQTLPSNLLQRSYAYMYAARNRFLHGNPVTVGTLRPGRQRRTLDLPSLASTVYWAALNAYLHPHIKPHPPTNKWFGFEMFDEYPHWKAMKHIYGL